MSRSYNDELQYLDKIDKNCWRIKKGFVPNMHVREGWAALNQEPGGAPAGGSRGGPGRCRPQPRAGVGRSPGLS